DETHALVERLLHAPKGSVALMPSATAAQAALAAATPFRPQRNRILITQLDFHSSRYLWSAQAQRGFDIAHLPAADGPLSTHQLVAAIGDRVAVVAVSLVSPKTGALLELEPVLSAARAFGARVVVDAYQAVGVVPIDVASLGVDAVVGGTHK